MAKRQFQGPTMKLGHKAEVLRWGRTSATPPRNGYGYGSKICEMASKRPVGGRLEAAGGHTMGQVPLFVTVSL